MSEDQLYELARRRIDHRNRRWMLWGFNLGALVLFLAVLVLAEDTAYSSLAAAIFFAWSAVFVVHTIMVALAESRGRAIENEVARLRDAVYEKPKRLELAEDGELIDADEFAHPGADKRQEDSV